MDVDVASSNDRWSGTRECFGADTFTSIQEAKVLVIGAGGIGCELLKNLVLSGFKHVDIVDLDTIDISNLNRQFLFRRRHVGHPKSVVARESALLYTQDDSECAIEAHHDDVKTLKYGPEYVKDFSIVLNALDNLSARRHVGRVCWSAGVPYVESGTAGWFGQVQPFVPGETGCFECETRAPPTTFPVCTIRSNPSKPIHTIMWAKHLFNLLFGKQTEENAVTDLSSNSTSDTKNDITQELKKAIEEDSEVLKQKEVNGDFAHYIFHKVFSSDILTVNTLSNLWTERAPPKPYSIYSIRSNESFAVAPLSSTASLSSASSTALEDQKMWSIQHCADVFLSTCEKLKKMKDSGAADEGLSWDKDEPLHLDFVVAASNLRSSQYGIPVQSKFTIKSDAGNIIPAIATTNAIIAGLIVIEAIKILTNRTKQNRSVYLVQKAKGRSMLLNAERPFKNPHCYVCSNQFLHIKVDTNQVNLKTFVEEILTKQLGVLQPSIIVGDDIIYESDGESDHQLPKTLFDVKIRHSAIVHVESFEYDFKLEVSIEHAPSSSFTEPSKPYSVIGSLKAPPAGPSQPNGNSSDHNASFSTTQKPAAATNSKDEPINLDDDDDDLEIIEDSPAPTTTSSDSSKKRTHDEVVLLDDDDLVVVEPPKKK